MNVVTLRISILVASILMFSGPGIRAEDGPKDVVLNYIANLIHEEWGTAREFWHTDELRRSQRLGITYLGTPLKVDCASPLIPVLDRVRTGDVVFGYGDVTIKDDLATVPLRIRGGSDAVEYRYHLLRTEDGWSLVSPLTAYTRAWHHRDTRYARVFYSDSTMLNQPALDALDAFVEQIADQLQIFDDDLRHLQNRKLEYYLCTEDEIERITGYAVHGMTSLPMDAIVTRHLPHHHELVHALTNYRLRRVNLHTLPIVQEGLAVALGGRWEKSADVLQQFGAFMLSSEFVQLDSILTNDGFQTSVGSLDISYAASGLLSRYLIDTYGITKFLLLYQRLSTPDTEVNEWPGEIVRELFDRVYRIPWSNMVHNVEAYAAANGQGRLRPGGAVPAGISPLSLSEEETTLKMWETPDTYVFAVTMDSEHPELVITLDERDNDVRNSYVSRMFRKHAPNATYAGAHFGIVVTNAEAGLYDYYTDNLLEKYVLSFDPSDDYWDDSAKTIRFQLKKDALPGAVADYDVRFLRP